MKICVLSGSPSGENSITLQTVLYLEKKFPGDSFEIIHAGAKIRSLERDLQPALSAIGRADLLLFCYPVYTFLVPSQLHRFLELLKEALREGACPDLSGKAAAQICTSKHFFDTTANAFIEENAADLGLSYAGRLSADMEDLLSEKGRREAVSFWRLVHFRVEKGLLRREIPSVKAPEAGETFACPDLRQVKKREGKEVVIVADLREEDQVLLEMIQAFQAELPYESRLVNIRLFPFKGGCLGCFHCAGSGKCIYTDHFDDFLRGEIQTGDAIVYAFHLTDHSMGSWMKMYDDRQFCNGHRTVTMGKPVGYLIHGDLSGEQNLILVIEGRAEAGGNFLAGCACSTEGGEGIRRLAGNLAFALLTGYQEPTRFLGVGGMKIFRDLIYEMQGMMKADHAFYREKGFYDFPQKKVGKILMMRVVGHLMTNRKLQKKMGSRMTEGMLLPYRKVIERAERE